MTRSFLQKEGGSGTLNGDFSYNDGSFTLEGRDSCKSTDFDRSRALNGASYENRGDANRFWEHGKSGTLAST